ncbi:AAA family ATPase [Actinospica sp. MGRD01-02]|uniref:AAA family ATPase n=1 Tax=Actinospica acidithermotolerans TaxID=2828514 RepID=A0A941IM57_9ACTN|nr:AAA family ATPase [Actinospica acidithermotolerans]MBR7829693.1 AAA family ATPase [Actinospica acidithermotolerans]
MAEPAVRLVGRDEQLDVFDGVLSRLLDGGGYSVLIRGEPGIGKSALLEAGLDRLAAATAGGNAVAIRSGSCSELSQHIPYAVLFEAIDVNMRSPERGPADSTREPARSGGRAELISMADPVAAGAERVLGLVDELCTRLPVVIAVDDLQWMDEPGMRVWQRLSQLTDQLPLALIGTCRLVPQRPEIGRLGRLLQSGPPDRRGVVIDLDRLGSDAAARIAAQEFGRVPGPRLAAKIAEAGGNPLYIRELLAILHRSSAVRILGGFAELREGTTGFHGPAGPKGCSTNVFTYPADVSASVVAGAHSLADALADRIGSLPSTTRLLLESAAILGDEFSVSDLAHITGRPAGALLEPLDQARLGGVIEPVGSRFRFRHDLLRQALYSSLPTPIRAALHQDAALALATKGAPIDQVTAQLLAALQIDSSASGIDTGILAWLARNSDALARRSPQVAATLLEQALAAATGIEIAIAGGALDSTVIESLQAGLSSAAFLLARHDQTERLAREVLAQTKDPELAARTTWHLAYTLMRTGRPDEARACVRKALAVPGTPPHWTARLTVLNAMTIVTSGQVRPSHAVSRHALRTARTAQDPMALAYAYHAEALCHEARRDLDAAMRAQREGLDAAGNDPDLTDIKLLLMSNLASSMHADDHLEEGARVLSEARMLAETIETPRRGALAIQAAELAFELGRWDDALAEIESISDVPDLTHEARRLGLEGLIAAHRDDQATLDTHLTALADDRIPSAMARNGATWLLLLRSLAAERAGNPPEAIEALTDTMNLDSQDFTVRFTWMPRLVRLGLTIGRSEIAHQAAAVAEHEARMHPTPRKRVWASWCHGLLESDLDRLREAADYIRASQRPLYLADCLEDAAATAAATGDLTDARSTLTEAISIYAGLQATFDIRRATARLRPYNVRLGVRGNRSRPQTGWDALTATELKIATLVARGESNSEIAAGLYLSRRTVECHVTHILRKLDADCRGHVVRHMPADLWREEIAHGQAP